MNLADALNLGCACQTLETPRLREQLETEPALAGLTAQLAESHPHLFSRSAVFLDAGVMDQITDAVATLERVIALPGWQQQALDRAPPIARLDHGPAGVFMGYDFHLAEDGPRTCFDREANTFFSRLAVAITENRIDPAQIGDGFVSRGTESILAACVSAARPASAAEIAALRDHMAKWSLHLDRKLSEIQRTGTPD